jgi:phosphohistidine swiveling domain-containing protein
MQARSCFQISFDAPLNPGGSGTPVRSLKAFSAKGVPVSPHISPNFSHSHALAAALVIDAGSPTGHMVLLVREFEVATILNTIIANQVLFPGKEITVDANYNNVYEGIIPELSKVPNISPRKCSSD